jgi:hypothetical protein
MVTHWKLPPFGKELEDRRPIEDAIEANYNSARTGTTGLPNIARLEGRRDELSHGVAE